MQMRSFSAVKNALTGFIAFSIIFLCFPINNNAKLRGAASEGQLPEKLLVEDIPGKDSLKPATTLVVPLITDLHIAKMRLAGSLCFSCLQTLNMKLKNMVGIKQVKIEHPNVAFYQSYTPDIVNWAPATIIYDTNALSLFELKAILRSNGYYPYKVSDESYKKLPPNKRG